MIDKKTREIIRTALVERMGFIDSGEIKDLAGINELRLMPVLIRFGAGRCSCPVQDVEFFEGLCKATYNKEKPETLGAYIRDVSLFDKSREFLVFISAQDFELSQWFRDVEMERTEKRIR